MSNRIRATFAGIEFSGFAHGGMAHVTVPLPAFRAILRAARFGVHLNYDIEHDGGGNNDVFARGGYDAPRWAANVLSGLDRRPHLLYLHPEESCLHYCPHSNLSYELRDAAGLRWVEAAPKCPACGSHKHQQPMGWCGRRTVAKAEGGKA